MIDLLVFVWVVEHYIESQVDLLQHLLVRDFLDTLCSLQKPVFQNFVLFERHSGHLGLLKLVYRGVYPAVIKMNLNNFIFKIVIF